MNATDPILTRRGLLRGSLALAALALFTPGVFAEQLARTPAASPGVPRHALPRLGTLWGRSTKALIRQVGGREGPAGPWASRRVLRAAFGGIQSGR